jgi:subfamily B ATP-binding cassette protein MsbA
MTIGALTVFITYLGKFFTPVKDLAKMTGSIATAMVSAERINMLLDKAEVMDDKPGAIEPQNIRGHIRFENIRFAYRKGNMVLDDVTLEILPGEHVGIVGPTGSGKSTLASLIPRFYAPQAGTIYLDGTNVADYTISGLRRQIAYVLQDTMLFYGTLRDNIAYGDPCATEEHIIAAARAAQADGFIRELPKGYDTMVGERGLTLSNGQRQRIGIARAILRNSPILILDEPTASLDAAAEKEVTAALQELMQGRTVITITHRLSTIAHADRIFEVSNHTVTPIDILIS